MPKKIFYFLYLQCHINHSTNNYMINVSPVASENQVSYEELERPKINEPPLPPSSCEKCYYKCLQQCCKCFFYLFLYVFVFSFIGSMMLICEKYI